MFVALQDSVKVRGLQRYITHDCIARGVFSLGFSSGNGAAEAWHDQCTNGADNELDIRLRHFFLDCQDFLKLSL